MKTLIIATGLLLFACAANAQQLPPRPPSVEERLKRTNELLQNEVGPTTAQRNAMESVFKTFFIAEDKLRKDNPPPPPPPPDPKVKEAMDKLVNDRDQSIKKILTGDQYQQYLEVVKKMHPPGRGE